MLGVASMEFLFSKADTNYAIFNCRENRERMVTLLHMLLAEADRSLDGCETVCQDLLEVLLIWLVRCTTISLQLEEAAPTENRECAEIKRYLDTNYREDISLDLLAELAHLNKYYLAHTFQREYGISPITYLNRRRIEESKHMLGNTGYSLAQISELMGFSSPSYFSQCFRKAEGMTPTNTAVRRGRENAPPRQNGMKYNENEEFMMKSVTFSLLQSAANAFEFGGPVRCDAHHYGEGHINDTFVVWREDHSKRFILQRINTDTFTNPVGLMENVCGVTRHLRAKILAEGGDPARETLNVIPTLSGSTCYLDADGGAWRAYDFVEDTICLQQVGSEADFRTVAETLGKFQNQLEDYPASTLHETITRFHDTPNRYANFEKALAADALGRAKTSRRKSNLSMRGSRTAMSCSTSLQLGKSPCASPITIPRSTMSSSMPLPEKASVSLTSTP